MARRAAWGDPGADRDVSHGRPALDPRGRPDARGIAYRVGLRRRRRPDRV